MQSLDEELGWNVTSRLRATECEYQHAHSAAQSQLQFIIVDEVKCDFMQR